MAGPALTGIILGFLKESDLGGRHHTLRDHEKAGMQNPGVCFAK